MTACCHKASFINLHDAPSQRQRIICRCFVGASCHFMDPTMPILQPHGRNRNALWYQNKIVWLRTMRALKGYKREQLTMSSMPAQRSPIIASNANEQLHKTSCCVDLLFTRHSCCAMWLLNLIYRFIYPSFALEFHTIGSLKSEICSCITHSHWQVDGPDSALWSFKIAVDQSSVVSLFAWFKNG